jgi:hypothetical protein
MTFCLCHLFWKSQNIILCYLCLILFHKNFLMHTNFTMLQLAYASFRHNDPIEGMHY